MKQRIGLIQVITSAHVQIPSVIIASPVIYKWHLFFSSPLNRFSEYSSYNHRKFQIKKEEASFFDTSRGAILVLILFFLWGEE
jgi:hypothetical protein